MTLCPAGIVAVTVMRAVRICTAVVGMFVLVAVLASDAFSKLVPAGIPVKVDAASEEEKVVAVEEDVVRVVLVAFAVEFALPLLLPKLWRSGTGISAWPGKVGGWTVVDDADAVVDDAADERD